MATNLPDDPYMNEYIKNCLKEILEAVYGRDVRRAIHDALEYAVRIATDWYVLKDQFIAEWEQYKRDRDAQWEAYHAAQMEEWNALKAIAAEYIDALYYVQDRTRDVWIDADDLKIDYRDPDSNTLRDWIGSAASDISIRELLDYIVNVSPITGSVWADASSNVTDQDGYVRWATFHVPSGRYFFANIDESHSFWRGDSSADGHLTGGTIYFDEPATVFVTATEANKTVARFGTNDPATTLDDDYSLDISFGGLL